MRGRGLDGSGSCLKRAVAAKTRSRSIRAGGFGDMGETLRYTV